MNRLAFLFLMFCFSIISNAQKVFNDPNAEVRNVTSFHALKVSGAIEVMLTQGNEEALAVSANDQEYTRHITTNVENGVLHIGFDEKGKWWSKNRKLKAYVSVKELDAITGSGASTIKIEGSLSATSLKIALSGATDIRGTLNIKALDMELSGASDATLSGNASEVKIKAGGASNVKAYEFTAATCSAKASGASDIKITVDKELSAHATGASSISYKGAGLIRDIQSSGASSVSRKS